jgi:prepilin-type N-terminal cleavage/methylation domain-containing protein
MNRRSSPFAVPRKALRAFTLVESMIAMLVLGVGTAMLYESFRSSLFLVDKNIAMNEADSNLQWGYYRMLTTLEAAGEFVDCATYNPATQTFTAVSSGTWGNAVRFMQLCPITCYVEPDDGSGYSVSNPPLPTTTTYLQSTDQSVLFSYNTALYNASCIPTDARLFPTYPELSGTVSTGSSPGVKPGLNFDGITTTVPGTITLHFPTPLGSNTFLYCNRAYFMVEGAFAVTTSSADGHKTLLYFPDTNQPSNSVVICQKMDGNNQTQPGDSSIPTGGTSGTFCIPSGSTSVQVLFPVRSLEFLNVMSRDGGSAARNNTWINVNCKFRQRETL